MILVTADVHLNDLTRDQYRHDWMANILPVLLKKYNVQLLIILGDLTDEKDRLSSWLVNQIVDHLTAITQWCPIIVQKGNHDYVVADNPFFEFLGHIPEITWINRPTKAIKTPHSKLLGNALFLPHTANYERDWGEFYTFEQELYFCHQTFQGAQVGPRKMDGIPTNVFPKDAQVVSGDIHQPQTFDNITYVGSPYLEDFGDNFKPRVLLLDPKKDTLKSIPSPGPQKRLIEISSLTDLKKQSEINEGDILKVRVTLNAADHAQWPTIQEEVKAWGAKNGFAIHLVQPKIENTSGGKSKARKADDRTDEQLLDTYAQSRSVGEATLKTGMNLLRKI